MSPEQVRGLPLDKRTDIWSFGCVLHEALTGRPVFGGASASDTVAAILRDPPKLDNLPDVTPAAIQLLIERCLRRDRSRRLRDIGDARIEIEEALTGSQTMRERVAPRMWSRVLWMLPGILLPILAMATWLLLRPVTPPAT